mgnify:CR=1 FL=1
MKNGLKLISMFMIAILAFGMAGCVKASKADVKELQQHKGEMLVIISQPQGPMPMTEEQYEAATNRMSLSYEGNAYIQNPVGHKGMKIPDEEYLKIYNFCVKAVSKNKFANYKEDVDDGMTYTFTYYDTDGNEHVIYDGYCYNNKELQGIIELISKYQCD